ncbi:hypothetical protein AFLA_010006 [Aspergillus flavus NRRL3357]|nr:hypothetical protein AFLA_010006 [Aspergillus flavus NRRL3357]
MSLFPGSFPSVTFGHTFTSITWSPAAGEVVCRARLFSASRVDRQPRGPAVVCRFEEFTKCTTRFYFP